MNKTFIQKVEKFCQRNKRILTLISVLVLTILVLLDQTVLEGKLIQVGLYINIFSALVFFTLMATIAGYAVIQSLFLLGAELTLMIFLAQSYCAVPARTEAGDSALQLLIMFGVFYILLQFGKSLYKRLADFTDSLPKEDKFWSLVILVIFLLLVGVFLYSIYQVVTPIFTNLCIYRPIT